MLFGAIPLILAYMIIVQGIVIVKSATRAFLPLLVIGLIVMITMQAMLYAGSCRLVSGYRTDTPR